MARFALLLLAALILTVLPASSEAGDLFTGFQIDNEEQYFSYLGVRTPVLQMSGGTNLFVQALMAGLGYKFKDNGQLLDANVQFIVPALGISQTLGGWTLSAQAGPQFRRTEQEQLNTSTSIVNQIGVYGQAEAFYWHEKGSFHAIGSYADLDKFYWSRLRGKLLAHKSDKGCCTTYVGWDAEAMQNADFRAVRTGPLVEIPIGKVFLLFRGGYQNSNTFHSGGYGGFEVYFGF
ncbi:MAG TPA: cellulose biosynthesis protein BcsS [Nitrospiraceae bacterium]|nr:cellulose biosynthesis protein BcsS [Nitrospiraceae bacterium]